MKVTNQSTTNSQLIDSKGADRTQGATETGKKVTQQTANYQSAKGGSLVEISDNARLMQKAVELAMQTPDGRAAKVANLKKSIQDGTYKVDARKVADRLVEDHLASDFGKNNL